MKRILISLLLALFLSTPCYALVDTYWASAASGGAAGSMDNMDGDNLSDGDKCLVQTTSGITFYHLNATSGAAESIPTIIAPDTNSGNKRWILAGSINYGIATLADEATPSVSGGEKFLTGGTTTITDFDDGYTGQIIRIVSEHAITITDGTNIFLDDGANFVMSSKDTLTLIYKADNKWYELARNVVAEAEIERSIPLPLGAFVLEDTGAPLTTSTTPGMEEDDAIVNIVWADGETSAVETTFPVPTDYASGGAFRIMATESDSTTPNEIDFDVYINTDGVAVDSSAADQTPVALAGMTSTPDVVVLSVATDFVSLAAGQWVTFRFWRDNTATGTGDLEAKGAEFYYTSNQ